jgi:hypothetical protein
MDAKEVTQTMRQIGLLEDILQMVEEVNRLQAIMPYKPCKADAKTIKAEIVKLTKNMRVVYE